MVKWVHSQGENNLDQANQILKDAEADKVELISTELAKYEIGNALRYKDMELPQAKTALGTIYALPVDFISLSEDSAKETIAIAKENNITYYDAAFVSLAKEKNAILITANPKHQRPFPGVKVIDLANY